MPGDEVYVEIDKTPNNMLEAYYVDYVRSKPLLILLITFILSMLVMGRWKGLGSLVSLGFSMVDDYRLCDPTHSRGRRSGQGQFDRLGDSFSGNSLFDLWLEFKNTCLSCKHHGLFVAHRRALVILCISDAPHRLWR